MQNVQIEKYSLAQIFWERRWLLVVIIIAAVVIAGIYAQRLPPEFQTEVILRLHAPAEVEAPVQSYIPTLPAITQLMKSQDVLLQAIKDGKFLSENAEFSEWSHPYAINWLAGHLSISQPDKTDLLIVQLYGPFSGGQKIREFMDHYWTAFQKKVQTQLQKNLQAEQERLELLKASFQQERENITQEASKRAASKRQLLQTQERELKQAIDTLKIVRNLRIPAGEQNATFEGATLREEFIALNNQLTEIQKELRLLTTNSVTLFADLQTEWTGIDHDLGKLNLLLVKLKHLSQNFTVLELVNAPLEPKAPTGPSKLGITLFGALIGFVVGLLLIFFLGPATERRKSPAPR
jgi:LPS O-antigen subunit length determinant protein (WzzB/FepE family)